MNPRQIEVLYRQFLFKSIDVQLLSTQGDIGRLLGQFVAFLLFVSFFRSIAILMGGSSMAPHLERSFVLNTMFVVGILSVLNWESTFPDKTDLTILGPMPVRMNLIFGAKLAASLSAMGIAIIALNAPSSLAWTMIRARGSSLLDLILTPANYWNFVEFWSRQFGAGLLVFCTIVGMQGVGALLLPRQIYLRVSAFLQMATFAFVLFTYAQGTLRFEASWLAMAVGACALYVLGYWRTLRRIVEQPDITGHTRWALPLVIPGSLLATAILQFTIRTITRSRQHRVLLAFYLGAGIGVISILAHSRTIGGPIFSSFVVMTAWISGLRVVFAIPTELKANWLFRTTQVRPAKRYLLPSRLPLFLLGFAPIWLIAVWYFGPDSRHLPVLGLWGLAVALLCAGRLRKIPFTCSYLPGKTQVHMVILAIVGSLTAVAELTKYEYLSFADPARYANLLGALAAACAIAAWFCRTADEDAIVEFEDVPPPAILELKL